MREWKLVGYDTYDNQWYPLKGGRLLKSGFLTEFGARRAAKRRLAELEIEQPSETSGGQSTFGIQDRVFIQRPNGTSYCFRPNKKSPHSSFNASG